MEKIKLAVVDDHELFREGVITTLKLIERDMDIVEASNGKEFIALLEDNKIDIALMDINMPELNGVDTSKIALEKDPDLKIIALTMQMEEEYLTHMLSIGVKGFLSKSIDKNDLERALSIVLSGKEYFSEDILPLFTSQLLNKNKKKNKVKLSQRELEVLGLIADGLTNQEIGEKLFISARTVSNHRANLLSKTDTKNTAALIAYALRNKLLNYD